MEIPKIGVVFSWQKWYPIVKGNPNKDTTPPVFVSSHSVVAGACVMMVYRRSVSYICATPYHSLPYRIEIINIFCEKYRKWGVEKMGTNVTLARIRMGFFLSKPEEREKKRRIIDMVMSSDGETLDYIYKSTNAIVRSIKRRS